MQENMEERNVTDRPAPLNDVHNGPFGASCKANTRTEMLSFFLDNQHLVALRNAKRIGCTI